MRMVATDYGQDFQECLEITHPVSGVTSICAEGYYDRYLMLRLEYSRSRGYISLNRPNAEGEQDRAKLMAAKPISNVRINDGGTIFPAVHQSASLVKDVDGPIPNPMVTPIEVEDPVGGRIYAFPPDVHRDFPIDVLTSDRTYTIEAWAVNEGREVLSPKATLKVRPVEQAPATLRAAAPRCGWSLGTT